MNARKVTAPARKRKYESPLREKQSAATRDLIVQALVRQIAEQGVRDFSLPRVAERAGVTVRTIYRYFPTRDSLFDAVDAEVARSYDDLPRPKDLDGITSCVRPMFESFGRTPQLVRALIRAEASHDVGAVRARGRRRRTEAIKSALRAEFPRMDEHERHRIAATLHYLFSAAAWDTLQQTWGLTEEEATDAIEWSIGALVAALRKGSRPKTSAQATSNRQTHGA